MNARLLRGASIAALAFASSATSLSNGFTYDDRLIVSDNRRIQTLDNVGGLFSQTYWPEENGAALYRPVTLVAFAIEWAAGDGSARVFHAVNVALYMLCALLVWWVASLLLPAAPAWIAGALFAIHPVHVEAVGNVVGQSELLAALGLLAGVGLYLRDRLRGELRRSTVLWIGLLYVFACLSKEHGIILPALLGLAELTVVASGGGLRARFQPSWRLYALLGAIAVTYFIVRGSVVGGLAGEFVLLPLAGAPFEHRLLTMFRVATEWGRLLLWPARLSGDYSPREIEAATTLTPTVGSGVAIAVCALALVVLTWRRRPAIAFALGWTMLALAPVSNLFVTSGYLLSERTLFTATVGIVLAVGAMVALLMEVAGRGATADAAALPTTWRVARAAGVAALAMVVVAGTVRSATRQRVWRDNETFFDQLLIDAPLSYRARWASGARHFEAGRPGLGEREMRYAIALFPHDPELLEDLATRYLRAGICKPAAELFRETLVITPGRGTSRMGLVACLMREGRYAEAAAEARTGLRYGAYHSQLARMRDISDSLSRAKPADGS